MLKHTKSLGATDSNAVTKLVPDVEKFGNPDTFQLLCKASSENQGWMKSTKAMQCPFGCIVQVTTQQRNPDGSYAIAEALTYVPDVIVIDCESGGRKLGRTI